MAEMSDKMYSVPQPDYDQTFYRNYDPAIGRFVGPDPMPETDMSLGNYLYAGDNPIMMNDPMGNLRDFADSKAASIVSSWGDNRTFGDGDLYGKGGISEFDLIGLLQGSTGGGGKSYGVGNLNNDNLGGNQITHDFNSYITDAMAVYNKMAGKTGIEYTYDQITHELINQQPNGSIGDDYLLLTHNTLILTTDNETTYVDQQALVPTNGNPFANESNNLNSLSNEAGNLIGSLNSSMTGAQLTYTNPYFDKYSFGAFNVVTTGGEKLFNVNTVTKTINGIMQNPEVEYNINFYALGTKFSDKSIGLQVGTDELNSTFGVSTDGFFLNFTVNGMEYDTSFRPGAETITAVAAAGAAVFGVVTAQPELTTTGSYILNSIFQSVTSH